jgi:hypothetical protein
MRDPRCDCVSHFAPHWSCPVHGRRQEMKPSEVDSMNRLRVQAENKAALYRRALLLACNCDEDRVAFFVSEANAAIDAERGTDGVPETGPAPAPGSVPVLVRYAGDGRYESGGATSGVPPCGNTPYDEGPFTIATPELTLPEKRASLCQTECAEAALSGQPCWRRCVADGMPGMDGGAQG